MLRCSTGQVFRIDTVESVTLHLAWFEWNDTDTGSVLEAFRHMPEACMGSLGLKLVSKEKPIHYTIRRQGAGGRGQEEATAQGISPTDNRQPVTDNSSTPSSTAHSLLFDHTVFIDPNSAAPGLQPRIHSFRAVWVSGKTEADARRGIDGHELDRLRAIRLKAAATRYRPTHARVIQGTVRGALNATDAWQAFEQHLLRDLTFER